jgi:phospholipid/cholesterol/gamma-HCH transport system substrate-binding protein
MNSRPIEFAVGLFVLLGLAAMAYLAIRIGGGQFIAPDTYELTARFNNASGLKKGSSIRIAGVAIGAVTSVALKPDDMVALVSFRVPANLKLDDDTVAAIKSSGLIGEKFIALKPGGSGKALKPAALIIDTESSVDLEDIISRFAFGSVDKK